MKTIIHVAEVAKMRKEELPSPTLITCAFFHIGK
jgi:hypothetical protein